MFKDGQFWFVSDCVSEHYLSTQTHSAITVIAWNHNYPPTQINFLFLFLIKIFEKSTNICFKI